MIKMNKVYQSKVMQGVNWPYYRNENCDKLTSEYYIEEPLLV